jgi:hypothetical protein
VAFVLKGYPRLSETFIAQEILALEQLGLDIEIVSLRHPTDRATHPVHGQIRAPVRYLPKWDSTLLAYAPPERVRILSEAHRRTVIGKNGDVAQTILVDGMVAGTWAIATKPAVATITVTPFGRASKGDRLALTEEGERLARFIAPASKAHRVTVG